LSHIYKYVVVRFGNYGFSGDGFPIETFGNDVRQLIVIPGYLWRESKKRTTSHKHEIPRKAGFQLPDNSHWGSNS